MSSHFVTHCIQDDRTCSHFQYAVEITDPWSQTIIAVVGTASCACHALAFYGAFGSALLSLVDFHRRLLYHTYIHVAFREVDWKKDHTRRGLDQCPAALLRLGFGGTVVLAVTGLCHAGYSE